MKTINKIMVLILLVIFIFVPMSVIIHESVHVIQHTLDPRVYSTNVCFLRMNALNDGISGYAEYEFYNETTQEQMDAFRDDMIYRELQAYAVQTAFIAIISIIIFTEWIWLKGYE